MQTMPQGQPTSYLESKVLTASPPRLHLMLVEGAIRFGRKAEQELAAGNEGYANEAMIRAIDVVAEMLAGVRHSDSDINQKLADLYQFLFHTLTSAYVNTDPVKLADVLRILEFERETWQLACDRGTEQSKPNTPIAPLQPSSPLSDGLSIEA
jgi:flagellar protein FliS